MQRLTWEEKWNSNESYVGKKFTGSYENVSLDYKIEGLHFKDASIKQTMKELIA